MPANRKKRRNNLKKPKQGKKRYLFFLLVLFLTAFLFFILRADKWNGKDKLSLVVKNEDYSLSIIVFDPELEEIYDLKIPGNTEIEVAGGYGVWKIRSLWALGQQEGLGGELVARSVITGMKIPVYAWADEQALGLVNIGFRPSFRALASSYNSNLIFGDRLRLLIFSSKVKNTNRVSIDLGNTAFLEKTILSDGEEGYRVTRVPPQRITAIFSEPIISNNIVRISVKDSTEKPGLARNAGSVIEVLGGKISSIEMITGFEGICILRSKDERISKILLKVFKCEEVFIDPQQSFDVEITFGAGFPGKY
jgi:hypothetical protein